MLKEMFREIQEILGDSYGLFREFDTHSAYSAETLEKYQNVGVLYVNDGNPNFIPDGASMTINYTLSLLMRIPEGQNTSDLTVEPLQGLSSELTGEIYSEGTKWRYVLNVGLPQSDGFVQVMGNGAQYINYDIPILAIVVSGVALSDNSKINVSMSVDGTSYSGALSAVVSAVEVPEVQMESAVFAQSATSGGVTYNAGEIESMPIAKGWSLRVIKLFRRDDPLDKALLNVARNTPGTAITLSYAMGDETAKSRVCYIHDVTVSNEKGQTVVFAFTLSQAMRPV